jgi:hypothetical protein
MVKGAISVAAPVSETLSFRWNRKSSEILNNCSTSEVPSLLSPSCLRYFRQSNLSRNSERPCHVNNCTQKERNRHTNSACNPSRKETAKRRHSQKSHIEQAHYPSPLVLFHYCLQYGIARSHLHDDAESSRHITENHKILDMERATRPPIKRIAAP